MKLLTKPIAEKLAANFAANASRPVHPHDFEPVLKLFVPWGAGTWLATEMSPSRILFGLAFIGPSIGEPELGYFALDELEAIRGPLGLRIERDMHFKANKTLSQYAEEARRKGVLVA